MVWVTVGLALIAGTTAHPQNSTTSCYGSGPWINCNTQSAPDPGGSPDAFGQGLANGARFREARLHAKALEAASREAAARQARYVQAGKLINAGQCADARTYALISGDLDLAQRVATLCPAPAAK